ncbi:hypothetical protein EJ110_NYTH47339 [Nymphaea thermarum]|nr:hypothetical protein EJ110_NYTH47339 [Nymphaea thermarum]
MWRGGESQGSAADVWALGCTMVEMATGRHPWAKEVTDPVSDLYWIGCTDTVPENLSEEGQDFIGNVSAGIRRRGGRQTSCCNWSWPLGAELGLREGKGAREFAIAEYFS